VEDIMGTGLTVQDCSGSVAEVTERLAGALQERGIELFTVIDHAAAARAAGLQLHDEVLAVFGNPAVGTLLMQRDPAAGIELPLRLLIWAGEDGTRAAYEPPSRLAERFDLAGREEVLGRLDHVMEGLVAAIR
jgi:uncharacterized protein (DUF302 family)